MVFISSVVGYILVMLLAVMGAASSSSMIFQWLCLEVSMLCIIPLLCMKMTKSSVECGVKYFISQSGASLIFLMGVILSKKSELVVLVSSGAILFKLGVPPFHSWLLSVVMNLGYAEMFALFSIQKFTPLIILSSLTPPNWVLWLIMFTSFLLILSGSELVMSIHYLLFLSSVGNGVWMLVGAALGGQWVMFLLGYSGMLLAVMFSLNVLMLNKSSDLALVGVPGLVLLSIQFFNLGGVPPLPGFFVKLMILKSLLAAGLILLLLVFLSMLLLFIYTSVFIQAYCFSPGGFNSVRGVMVGPLVWGLMVTGVVGWMMI